MSACENLPPAVLRRVMKEVHQLSQKPPEGIKVTMPEQNLTEIHAIIEGPEKTPYEGGSFKMKLKLGADFPQAPPKGFFLTKIFHPNVAANGDICVNTLKKDWKPTQGIEHLLLTIKCLLIYPNPESALNEEAGKLLLEDYDSFAERAKLMTSIHAASKSAAGKKTTAAGGSKVGSGAGAKAGKGATKGNDAAKKKKRAVRRL
mmetsp:Transcript_31886/g.89306  ORF Transcript_31886/g.89306 Transcript_31886/m.89306 type:complete len:203 (+) Transcript_31886:118-726(+)